MGTSVMYHQETRPILDSQTPLQRARSRHAEVVEICQHLVQALHAWGRLGKLCTLVERDKDYVLLGFETFGQWMMKIEEVSGYSRASAYSYKKLYEELEPLWATDVHELSLGTANVVKLLPTSLQRDPAVRSAAKQMKPKQFREKIAKDHPDAHVEMKEKIELNLESSAATFFHEIVESMRVLEEDPELSYERAVEIAMASWMSEPWEDSGITKLERARQLRSVK
jgi:hypothetical protein